jgi:hypothetical protein
MYFTTASSFFFILIVGQFVGDAFIMRTGQEFGLESRLLRVKRECFIGGEHLDCPGACAISAETKHNPIGEYTITTCCC